MDYNSKYTGEEVEQLLDKVANGDFYTKDEIDSKLGDINIVLESIINS